MRIPALIVALWTGSATADPVQAQDASASEYAVKAAFLFNFAKFAEWPEETWGEDTDPFIVCILGQDPFGQDLEEIASQETIHDRPIRVRRVQHVSEVEPCHILYVSESEQPRTVGILRRLSDRPVLTVGDFPEFVDHGGAIGFVLQKDRVRFLANAASAQRGGVRLSSKLMKIAMSQGERDLAR